MPSFTFLCFVSILFLGSQCKDVSFKNVKLETGKNEVLATITEDTNIKSYLPTHPMEFLAITGRISILYENSITDINNIKHLSLFKNEIEEIRPGAFRNFNGVERLDISYSNFTTLKRNTFGDLNLKLLRMTFNRQLETLEEGALDNPHIEGLSLSYNALKTLPKNIFRKMPNLKILDVSANSLTEILPEFVVGLNLVRVFFAYNKLTSVSSGIFNNHQTLQEVDLSENKITEIDSAAFDDMLQLKNASLALNKISKIDRRWFHNTPNMRRVNFIRNIIEEVPDEAFINFENLEVINLEENAIKKVSPTAFKGLKRIHSLRLGLNAIDKWDGRFLTDVDVIESLDLSSNKIKCPEGDFDGVFKAASTVLRFNPLDSECVEKIENWQKLGSSTGHVVCTKFECKF